METAETVTLQKWDGSCKEFEFEHAVRLLNYTSGGWKISAKSNFKFKDGNLIRKQNKRIARNGSQVEQPVPSDLTPEKD